MLNTIELVELSEGSKTKLCLVKDIIRINKLLTGKELEPEVFYELYDCPIDKLEEVIRHGEQVVKLKHVVEQFQQNIMRKHEEDGN